MPVFNGEATIEESLKSLLGQSDGVELIAVDQGSKDRSADILREYQDRLDITIISAPQNKNWMQNTTLAVENTRAQLVTMLHQDDIWLPGRTKVLGQMFKAFPNAGLWVHPSDYIDDQGKKVGRIGPPFGKVAREVSSQEALESLLVQNTISLPAVMFRKQDYQSYGGLDEMLWHTADWDFWLSVLTEASLAWHPRPLTGYRVHAGAITVHGTKDLRDYKEQLTIPFDRHISGLRPPKTDQVRKLYQASVAVNLSLAKGLHGPKSAIFGGVWQVIRLGPLYWSQFLRRTQLFQRVSSRLKLLR